MKTSVRNNKNSTAKNSVFTAETLGVVLVLFSTFAFVCLISGGAIFSDPGRVISRFLRGTFGYFSYPLTLFFILRGIMLIVGKKMPGGFKTKLLSVILLVIVAALVHAVSMHGKSGTSYGEYLSLCYDMAKDGSSACSGGGFIAGLYTYFFTALLTDVGSYVVLAVLIALTCYGFVRNFNGQTEKERATEEPKGSFVTEDEPNSQEKAEAEPQLQSANPTSSPSVAKPATAKLFVADSTAFEFKSKKDVKSDDGIKFTYASKGLGVAGSYSAGYNDDLQSKINYVKTPSKIVPTSSETPSPSPSPYNFSGTTVSESISKTEPSLEQDVPVIPLYEHDESKGDTEVRAESFSEKYAEAEEYDAPSFTEPEDTFYPIGDVSEEKDQPIVEEKEDDVFKETFGRRVREPEETPVGPVEEQASADEEPVEEQIEDVPPIVREQRGRGAREFFNPEPKPEPEERVVVPEKPPKEVPPINREYFRPPLDLLASPTHMTTNNSEDHEERMEIIKRTLEEFHISAEPQGYVQGPAITQYAFKIPAGVVVSRVLGYADNLKMRLAVKDGVRIQAPIPGKDLIGIEVANKYRETITLRELMESPAAAEGKSSELKFAVGKNIVGECVFDNLAKGVHYLVAGSTGSGKSVCLHVLITSLIMRYSPEDLRLIFIDPKQVEFRVYEHLPHLMSDEIITDPKRVIAVLNWAIEEMERRYSLFAAGGGIVDNIESYNEYIASDTVARLPRIVIVVDELADLMSVCKKDLEARIARLTAKARAAGIHLVLTTQRPSVDVITGVIKSNLPSRIALKVSNFNDSQTIMNEAGAEKLLGNGDMLFKNAGMNNFERYLGAYLSKMEIFNVVKYIKEHNKAYFDDDFKEYLENSTNPKPEEPSVAEGGEGGEPSDSNAEIFIKALAFAVTTGKVSISLIQRRFQIGYIRAAGLIDKMEQNGYIAPSEGSKSRSVFLTREQFEEKFGPLSEA